MTDLKVFAIAATGTLFLQTVEPLRLDYRPENITEMLLRAGLSLLVGIVTTLTLKAIGNFKIRRRPLSSPRKNKTSR